MLNESILRFRNIFDSEFESDQTESNTNQNNPNQTIHDLSKIYPKSESKFDFFKEHFIKESDHTQEQSYRTTRPIGAQY